MSNKEKPTRDAFTFNLRGMTATASFFIPPVIEDDAINRAWDQKFKENSRPETEPESRQGAFSAMRGWLFSRSTG